MVRVSVGEGSGRGIGLRRRKQENHSCTILGSITVWGGHGEGKGGVLPQKSKQKSSKNGLNKGKMNEGMRERLTQRQCFWVLLILFLINRQNREGIVQVAVIFLSF